MPALPQWAVSRGALPGRSRAGPAGRRPPVHRGPDPAPDGRSARVNPATIMPAYHRTDGLTRVAPAFRGKPVLSAAADRGRGRVPDHAEMTDMRGSSSFIAGRRAAPRLRGAAAAQQRARSAGRARGGDAQGASAGRRCAAARLARPAAADRERQLRAPRGPRGQPDDRGRPRQGHPRFTEKNPQPNVVDCHLGPRAGRARGVDPHPHRRRRRRDRGRRAVATARSGPPAATWW